MSTGLTFEKLSVAKSFTTDQILYEVKIDCSCSDPGYSGTMTWVTEEFKIGSDQSVVGVARRVNGGPRSSRLTIEAHENKLRIMDGEGDRCFTGHSKVLDGFMDSLRAFAK